MNFFLLLFSIISISLSCFAQDLPMIKGDTLYNTSGYKIIKDQPLKIGVGTMTDGDFKYIRINSASLFNNYSLTGYQGLANQANALQRSKSGMLMKVVKLQKRGSEKNGFVYKFGEIAVPDEFKPKTETAS